MAWWAASATRTDRRPAAARRAQWMIGGTSEQDIRLLALSASFLFVGFGIGAHSWDPGEALHWVSAVSGVTCMVSCEILSA